MGSLIQQHCGAKESNELKILKGKLTDNTHMAKLKLNEIDDDDFLL